MTRNVIIYGRELSYLKEAENLRSFKFNPIFIEEKEAFLNAVKEPKNGQIVVLFCDGADCLVETREIMKNLKQIKEMEYKSIFVVFENDELVILEDFRINDDFIVRPYSKKTTLKRLDNLFELASRNKKQEDEIRDLLLMHETMTKLVATVINQIIPQAEQHCFAVGKYTAYISNLYNEKFPEKLSTVDLNVLQNLVLLHDIGLIYVESNVVYVQRVLDYEEELELRKHSLIGGQLFRLVRKEMVEKYGKTPSFIERAIEVIEYHHEVGDGTGYPFGLKGKNIPLFARLISTSEYFVNEAKTPSEIVDVAKSMVDRESEFPKFDQEIVELINENIDELVKIAQEVEVKNIKTYY